MRHTRRTESVRRQRLLKGAKGRQGLWYSAGARGRARAAHGAAPARPTRGHGASAAADHTRRGEGGGSQGEARVVGPVINVAVR
eukprot:5826050-Prymnesium_polylepis.1